MHRVRYTHPDGAQTVMELTGDWADICNAARARIFPNVTIEHYRQRMDK